MAKKNSRFIQQLNKPCELAAAAADEDDDCWKAGDIDEPSFDRLSFDRPTWRVDVVSVTAVWLRCLWRRGEAGLLAVDEAAEAG